MADITKCDGKGCDKREFCYRFTAMADRYGQSYFTNAPIKKDGTCDEYWEIKCPYCGQYAGIHKLSCSTGKITMKL
jgi:hypothetical protein